ncbi:2,4'-dihydroxyacetophenone dioxygenase family protein [Paenibacillus oenotherae]|uniref:2,4'-dihydroxyacetophenone dioxygenase family protein n=1 Tax=Paenibacillus oenotherae TaxID=1435645 RepID=A0ABS7DAV2_9BACL|nr:2,4'-dihydroxyacetophenone dioxygenase family protein [Paenibacillus oenotherae]MBW7476919.1 2,4'-dihydroxyacetophenone dioxygenase family protein [Paenibacillus oenotherae]
MGRFIDNELIKLAEQMQLPERIVHMDDVPWVPFDDGACHFKPLRFDLATGTWIYLFKIQRNKTLNPHRHTGGSVIGYNLQGRWGYTGRNWVAEPGTFIFEPPGDIHTLVTEDEEVIALFILGGTLQYFDSDYEFIGQDDVFTVLKKYRDYCTANGLPIREDLIY